MMILFRFVSAVNTILFLGSLAKWIDNFVKYTLHFTVSGFGCLCRQCHEDRPRSPGGSLYQRKNGTKVPLSYSQGPSWKEQNQSIIQNVSTRIIKRRVSTCEYRKWDESIRCSVVIPGIISVVFSSSVIILIIWHHQTRKKRRLYRVTAIGRNANILAQWLKLKDQ